MDKLKPCPFCGYEKPDLYPRKVHCPNCATTVHTNDEYPERRWNTRTDEKNGLLLDEIRSLRSGLINLQKLALSVPEQIHKPGSWGELADETLTEVVTITAETLSLKEEDNEA